MGGKTQMKMNKRGQTIELTSGTVIAFMALILTMFAVLYGVAVLNPAGFFTTGSANANATNNMVGNLTDGASQFAGFIPTTMKVLAVVIVLSAIVFLIVFVRRMQGTTGGQGGL